MSPPWTGMASFISIFFPVYCCNSFSTSFFKGLLFKAINFSFLSSCIFSLESNRKRPLHLSINCLMKRLLKFKTKVLYILGVFLLIWGVQLLFSYSAGFRRFYFSVFYPLLSSFLRQITGWFPFSIGDFLYVAGGAWLLIGIYYFVKKLILFKKHPFEWLGMVLRFVMIVLTVYFVFLFLWGFNYRYDQIGSASCRERWW